MIMGFGGGDMVWYRVIKQPKIYALNRFCNTHQTAKIPATQDHRHRIGYLTKRLDLRISTERTSTSTTTQPPRPSHP